MVTKILGMRRVRRNWLKAGITALLAEVLVAGGITATPVYRNLSNTDYVDWTVIKKASKNLSEKEMFESYQKTSRKAEEQHRKAIEDANRAVVDSVKRSNEDSDITISSCYYSDSTVDGGYSSYGGSGVGYSTAVKAIHPDNPPGVIKLNELDRYMKVDKNHNLHFNYQAAIRDGVPPVKVYFGLHAAAAINKMVWELRDNGKISDDTSKEIDSLFSPSFKYTTLSLGEACGGGYDNPHPCPPREDSGVYRNTKDKIKNYLLSHGFHVVPGYATYSYGDDFAKVVSAYGCDWGPFRHEAWPVQIGSRWTYKYQTPEPNPEILSYTWPAWWWGAYVNWWHRSYC